MPVAKKCGFSWVWMYMFLPNNRPIISTLIKRTYKSPYSHRVRMGVGTYFFVAIDILNKYIRLYLYLLSTYDDQNSSRKRWLLWSESPICKTHHLCSGRYSRCPVTGYKRWICLCISWTADTTGLRQLKFPSGYALFSPNSSLNANFLRLYEKSTARS